VLGRWDAADCWGRYAPTAKNGIVENLYLQHGFTDAGLDGTTRLYSLDLGRYQLQPIPIVIHEPELAQP
jgi:hypothetical protein